VLKEENGHRTLYLTGDFEVRDGTPVSYISLGDRRVARVEEPALAATFLSDVAPASGTDQDLIPDPDGLITAGDAWLALADAEGLLGLADGAAADPARLLLHASADRILNGLDERIAWLHADHLGSVVAETGEDGKATARREVYPYGGERYAEGATDPHGFTGKEEDDATGLVYFGARYYDPWTGRWTAADPAFRSVTEVGEVELPEITCGYGYTLNNPVNNHDPDGQKTFDASVGYAGNQQSTVKALTKGHIRPTVGFMTTFGIDPGKPISKKMAKTMVREAVRLEKTGNDVQAFAIGFHAVTVKEWNQGLVDVQNSIGMQRLTVKHSGLTNLSDFTLLSNLRAQSTEPIAFSMRETFQTTKEKLNQELFKTMPFTGGMQFAKPTPTVWQRVKAFFGKSSGSK